MKGHTPDWSGATFFSMKAQWNPVVLKAESVNYQRTLAWLLEKEMQRRGGWMRIDAQGNCEQQSWWNLEFGPRRDEIAFDLEDWCERVLDGMRAVRATRELAPGAVITARARYVADVPRLLFRIHKPEDEIIKRLLPALDQYVKITHVPLEN